MVYNFGIDKLEESKYITNNIYTKIGLPPNDPSILKNETSMLSMCPSIKVDNYKNGTNGFIGGNSMVNVSSPIIDDMTRQIG